ncbi:MAG: hypothetical protein ACKOC5_14120 [Chloroflexota bacterium]
MSESMRMWVEIGFNISYLVVVWGLVITLVRKRGELPEGLRVQSDLATWAFALLALGDTGHVGFRVWAYALGSLDSRVPVLGYSLSLVGVGALATAYTVTLFYMLALELWRVRFGRRYGWFEYLLLAAGVVRLAIMALPANEWSRSVPPQPWSLLRNLPLMLQGLGLAYLVLREARRAHDRAFTWVGVSILVSYACYTPVILFVQSMPLLGMLMIPKTMAYVAIGFIIYADLHGGRQPAMRAGEAIHSSR